MRSKQGYNALHYRGSTYGHSTNNTKETFSLRRATEHKCEFSRKRAVKGQKCHNPGLSGNVNYCTSGGNQGMTQSASEWDGEIPQAHCEHRGQTLFIQPENGWAVKLGYNGFLCHLRTHLKSRFQRRTSGENFEMRCKSRLRDLSQRRSRKCPRVTM